MGVIVKRLCFSVLMMSLLVLSAEATTYYVSRNSVAEGVTRDGLSLETAFADVRDAVNIATADEDVIEIGEGVYEISQRIEIDKPITLRGAVNAAGEPISEIKNITLTGTQDASKKAQVLRLSNNCRVESLILSDGYLHVSGDTEKEKYRGSVLQMNDAVVTNCVIQGGRGYTDGNSNDPHSVGVFMDGSKSDEGVYFSRLENCIIRNNFNRQGHPLNAGGGVCVLGSGLVSNCVISNNLSHGPGGGVVVAKNCDGIFVNCVIIDNYGGYNLKDEKEQGGNTATDWVGSGIGDKQSNGSGAGAAWRGTFVNCLIAGNHSRRGKAESKWSEDVRAQPGAVSSATLYGCTVVGNEWDNKFGGLGVSGNTEYYPGLFNCTAYNTLVWGNTVVNNNKNKGVGSPSVYNWESKCSLNACWTTPTGTGVALSADPALTDYTISAAWPFKSFIYAFAPNPADGVTFINAGDNEFAKLDISAVDLAGQVRSLDSCCDIGCLETKSLEEIFTMNVKNRDTRTHKSAGCDLEITGNTGKMVGYTLQSSTDNFATTAGTDGMVTQTGNGETHLEVIGLQPGTTYMMRLLKTGEDDPVASWEVTTYERSIHVVDDLTVDDGDDSNDITVRIDEIFSGTVTATVTVDGTYTKTATFTVGDAPALITIAKSEYAYTASSTVDAVFVATDSDGTVYEPLVLETGRKLFVNPLLGNDGNKGKYWAMPKKTIQSALAELANNCANVTMVVLQEGIYEQSANMDAIVVDKPVTVVGEGDVKIADLPGTGTSGDAILTIDHANAVVTNVTISGARWNNNYKGGRRAVLIKQGLLVDSVVRDTAVAEEVYGVGVNLDGGEMRGCTVSGCFAKTSKSKGAGVFIDKNALVDRCVISENVANEDWVLDGSWANPAGTPMGNATGEGAGVYLAGGILRNSLVTGNIGAVNGGGIYLESGIAENCTVVTNTSVCEVKNETGNKSMARGNETVAGVYIAGGSLVNTIVWDNVNTNGVKDVQYAGELNGTVTRSCFSEAVNMNGNIADNPLFTDAANGDYTLTETSPCVDKGKRLSWLTDALDLVGNARERGNRVDLGCYESEYSRTGDLGLLFLIK